MTEEQQLEPSAVIAERLVDAEEAAEYLGFAPLTIRRWAHAGRLPGYPFPCGGGKFTYRFRISELSAYLDALKQSTKGLEE